jgi:hypothetical protein
LRCPYPKWQKRYGQNCDCSFIAVGVAVLGGGEEREGERGVISGLLVLEAAHLNLVAADDELEGVGVEEAHRLISAIVVRARSHLVCHPVLVALVHRVRPKEVA